MASKEDHSYNTWGLQVFMFDFWFVMVSLRKISVTESQRITKSLTITYILCQWFGAKACRYNGRQACASKRFDKQGVSGWAFHNISSSKTSHSTFQAAQFYSWICCTCYFQVLNWNLSISNSGVIYKPKNMHTNIIVHNEISGFNISYWTCGTIYSQWHHYYIYSQAKGLDLTDINIRDGKKVSMSTTYTSMSMLFSYASF
jgi:hypothetical protein